MTADRTIRAVTSQDAEEPVDIEQLPVEAKFSDEFAENEDSIEWEEEALARPVRNWRGWLVTGVAVITAAGWTGFFAWAHQGALLGGATPIAASALIADWAIPITVILVAWAVLARSRRHEAARFDAAVNDVTVASADLEDRLSAANRELSLAREFLTAQARDLESLGRVAEQRLTESADSLRHLIVENTGQVEAVATASATARENMEALRENLPVLATSARDVSNQIGTAGRTAQAQVGELVAGFGRLNEFGQASERQVEVLRARIDAALVNFTSHIEATDDASRAQLSALQEHADAFDTRIGEHSERVFAALRGRVDELDTAFDTTRTKMDDAADTASAKLEERIAALRTDAESVTVMLGTAQSEALAGWDAQVKQLEADLRDAVARIRAIDEQALSAANTKLDELRAEAATIDEGIEQRNALVLEKLAARRATFAKDEVAAVEQLTRRLDHFDNELTQRRDAEANLRNEADALASDFAARVEVFEASLQRLAETAGEAQTRIAEREQSLRDTVSESQAGFDAAEARLSALTDASVRLLELIQASAQHSRDELPSVLNDAEEGLQRVLGTSRDIREEMAVLSDQSESVSNYIITARDNGRATYRDIEQLQERLGQHATDRSDELDTLRAKLAELIDDNTMLSDQSRVAVEETLTALDDAAGKASLRVAEALEDRLVSLEGGFEQRTGEAINAAFEKGVAGSIAELDGATARAGSAGLNTVQQLRDQLAKVNELTGNLETRIARARELSEEQVDNDFARRVALITEALNSSSIDIAKALSEDVTDTAWASYLRGDRGIFTRRAVRLLDNTEAREIAEIYDADADFRENVSRYIHDFEAMLRSMLSTRDGNALGVTLLSSDMGKLYVVLAQAIERLRE